VEGVGRHGRVYQRRSKKNGKEKRRII